VVIIILCVVVFCGSNGWLSQNPVAHLDFSHSTLLLVRNVVVEVKRWSAAQTLWINEAKHHVTELFCLFV